MQEPIIENLSDTEITNVQQDVHVLCNHRQRVFVKLHTIKILFVVVPGHHETFLA